MNIVSNAAQIPYSPPKRVRALHPVQVRIKVHCGCGENFTTIQGATDHAEEAGHTLHINGEIRAQKLF